MGKRYITSTAAQDGLYIEEMESAVAFVSDGKMDEAAMKFNLRAWLIQSFQRIIIVIVSYLHD